MASLDMRDRVLRVADALSLTKLLAGVLVFVLMQGSPLYALGAAFTAPIVFAALVRIGMELRAALTGRTGARPPERLGLPSWERSGERIPRSRPTLRTCGMTRDGHA